MAIANSPMGPSFESLLASEFGRDFGSVHLRYSLLLWVNDGLMAVFFLLVGLEIKRELVSGQLSTPAKAALPIIAALGGVLAPALIYMGFNVGTPTAGGWGIPMATDIAFALAVITMLGKRVPPSLKIFLAALAIADDLMAILVIALFYSSEIHVDYLLYAGGVMGLLLLFNRLQISNVMVYVIPGMLMWYFVHHSGIHATIAGVMTALAIPVKVKKGGSPLEKLEHLLINPVNFLIMPLFALCNTNIAFEEGMAEQLATPLGMGILFGLAVGKPAGITAATWFAVKLNVCSLPENGSWKQLFGVGILAGIGFTMSIFIAMLSFKGAHDLESGAKFSVLVASLLSGVAGALFLAAAGKDRQE